MRIGSVTPCTYNGCGVWRNATASSSARRQFVQMTKCKMLQEQRLWVPYKQWAAPNPSPRPTTSTNPRSCNDLSSAPAPDPPESPQSPLGQSVLPIGDDGEAFSRRGAGEPLADEPGQLRSFDGFGVFPAALKSASPSPTCINSMPCPSAS